jgi:ABC-type uncharacterized transport system substrate-binding protein
MRTIRRAVMFDTVRRFSVRAPSACMWVTAVCILLSTLTGSCAAAQTNTKNVLVVFSSSLNDREQRFLEVMESTVRARTPKPVNFSVAYLDFQRLEDDSYGESMAEALRHEFRGVKLDLVIASGIEAIQFVVQYRDKIFPRVPIVFTTVHPRELEGQKLLPEMIGMTSSIEVRETIDLALRLHPDTKTIAIVDASHNFWWTVAHSELLREKKKVSEIDILGLPSREMLERIAALPPHTVILFQLAPESSTEPAIGAYDILTAAARHLPTYSAWDNLCLNYGCIGGVYSDWRRIAQSTGAIAARVLSGERPENIPIAHDTDFQVQVDWRALQRWHIPESTLPADGMILYRPPSFWEQYRKYLLAAISLIVAL